MVTLKAARLLHVETGEIEEPGLITVDGDRIASGGGEGEGTSWIWATSPCCPA